MSRAQAAAIVFLAATVTGVYFAVQALWNPAYPPVQRNVALGVNLTFYYIWALLTPFIALIARRFRFESGRWPLSIVVHTIASIVLTTVQLVVGESILLAIFRMPTPSPFWRRIEYALLINFQSSLPTYWLILFVYLAFDYYVKYRDRELRTAQLSAQLSDAQLQALKMQLKPHFLFNTLNSISSLMYTDVDAADRMVARLSDFLRLTLDREPDQEVTLAEELEFVRRYLEIEKIRFEDRLSVAIVVSDDVARASVPTLALQPLVENAIRHGIASRAEGGTITIRASRMDQTLHISICDNGVGQQNDQPRERVGLANTRSRLHQLYGDSQHFSYRTSADGGFVVDIEIPFRTVMSTT